MSSLGTALQSAVNGLQTAQAGISLVSQNISNANVAGYTKKTLDQTLQVAGNQLIGVRTLGAQRTLDTLLQATLRTQVSSQNYATIRSSYISRLGGLYGTPGSNSSLDGIYNSFTSALQQLSTSPNDQSAQQNVLSTASTFAQSLNTLSSNVQGLRTETEQGISDAVNQANSDLGQIQQLDQQIVSASADGSQPADLLDKRDKLIDDLSTLVDIRVNVNNDNSVAISTNSGVLLYDRTPAKLTFDARATITPASLYNIDPTQRGVGTISITTPSGETTDLVAKDAFRSGKIAGYLSLRDDILPAAQQQLDELAAGLSRALSDKTVTGTAVNSPPATASSGYAVDASGLQDGDSITLKATVGGVAKTITIVRVDDPSKLPLSNTTTPDPNDQVIGVSFANGLTQAAAAIQTGLNSAFGAGSFQVSSLASPAGNLQILNDVGGVNQVNSLTATVTQTSLQAGSPPTATATALEGATGIPTGPNGFNLGQAATGTITTTNLASIAPGSQVVVQLGTHTVTLTEGVDFSRTLAANATGTAPNQGLATALNTALSAFGASATFSGSTISLSGGTDLTDDFTINGSAIGATATTLAQSTTAHVPADTFTLQVGNGSTLTFTYVAPPANTSSGQFSDLASLADAINKSSAGSSVVASVTSSNKLQIQANGTTTAFQVGGTFNNGAGTINFTNTATKGLQFAATSFAATGADASLPFFVDGTTNSIPYTGNLDGIGQKIGFAQRIAINPTLISDPGKLVSYTPSISPTSSDGTRANAIINRLGTATRLFLPAGGLGSTVAPVSSTVTSYLQQIVDLQGSQSSSAQSIKDGQDVVVNGLQTRFDTSTKVNTDDELANLVVLQQTYQASAKILATINTLFSQLFGLTTGVA